MAGSQAPRLRPRADSYKVQRAASFGQVTLFLESDFKYVGDTTPPHTVTLLIFKLNEDDANLLENIKGQSQSRVPESARISPQSQIPKTW